MKVSYQDKGNTSYKLTVTAFGEIRIKVKSSDPQQVKDAMYQRLLKTAKKVMALENIVTLRGKVSSVDCNIIHMYADNKKSHGGRKTFQIEI